MTAVPFILTTLLILDLWVSSKIMKNRRLKCYFSIRRLIAVVYLLFYKCTQSAFFQFSFFNQKEIIFQMKIFLATIEKQCNLKN